MRHTRLMIIAALAALCADAGLAQPGKTVRLLTVGNSFSENATTYLPELVKAGGNTLIMGHADLAGCSLERHITHAKAAAADPNDEAGRPYSVPVDGALKQCSLRDILMQEKWDVVTIQQYSWISHDPSTYRPFARELRDYISTYAPQAKVVIHETWAYRRDDPRFTSGEMTQEKMYKDLSRAYRDIAAELGLPLIPVGDAFYAADTSGPWGYRPVAFDSRDMHYPNLPDQTHSLHVGWYWTKNESGANVMEMDGHHANANGCYLAGCVWYEFLFGQNVENNSYIPAEITPADAKLLRHIAHKTMHAE